MKTTEELSSILAHLTAQYTESYFRQFKKSIDKQMWAALHIGFIGALKEVGYSEEELQQIINQAKKKISQYETR